MKKIIIIIFLIFVIMLQIGILSQIRLQAGKLDLMLLVITALVLIEKIDLTDAAVIGITAGLLVGTISAEPMLFGFSFYAAAVVLTYFIRERGWKIPLITMFIVVALITITHHGFFGAYLMFTGANLTLNGLVQKIILPSMMLNIIMVIPVYYLVLEVWQWFSPLEEEV